MVNAEEILSMEYLKKSDFSGSSEGMRYRLEKIETKHTNDSGEEYSVKELLCTIWPEPFNFHSTPEDKKTSQTFSFDRDGVIDAVAWMNNMLFENKELFSKASANWKNYEMAPLNKE